MAKKKHEAATGNQLFYGDNLAVLRESIGDESVDLVYLDPPPRTERGAIKGANRSLRGHVALE